MNARPGANAAATTPKLTRAEAGELTAWMEMYSRGLFETATGIAKLAISEPRPDRQGIDVMVHYPSTSLGVQVKSTYGRRFNRHGTLQFPVEQSWVNSWHGLDIPPRMVVYLLRAPDAQRWCDYRSEGELHRARAYWALLDEGVSVPSVTIERSMRFTPATLAEWGAEIEARMGGRP